MLLDLFACDPFAHSNGLDPETRTGRPCAVHLGRRPTSYRLTDDGNLQSPRIPRCFYTNPSPFRL